MRMHGVSISTMLYNENIIAAMALLHIAVAKNVEENK